VEKEVTLQDHLNADLKRETSCENNAVGGQECDYSGETTQGGGEGEKEKGTQCLSKKRFHSWGKVRRKTNAVKVW